MTLYENPIFPGGLTAMAPPLTDDGQVTYADGTPATKQQMAEDVSAFLMWAAEPKMMARKSAGLTAVLFLAVITGLLWYTNKKNLGAAQGQARLPPSLNRPRRLPPDRKGDRPVDGRPVRSPGAGWRRARGVRPGPTVAIGARPPRWARNRARQGRAGAARFVDGQIGRAPGEGAASTRRAYDACR